MRYLTTPLYYVNARPHLGHAYTTLLTDMVKRHWVQRGEQVTFLTGTDEHGEKIAQMATKQNITPAQLATDVAEDYQATWKKMNIDFDIFYRTTDPNHIKSVQHALTQLKEKGEIVFREYEGNYCVGCERFLTDTELTDKGLCPDHLIKPEPRKEGNYFFLMSKYQAALVKAFESNPKLIQPEHYRNEILSFLKKEVLGDLCISRPKTRLTWGIEIPFDTNYVTYVWFDALLNYLVATGWPNQFNRDQWQTVTHFIGKDIVKTHAVYWGAMLMALEVPLFASLNVGGYWLMGGTKMSKTLGNVVRPLELESIYGEETLRFYLFREMAYGMDSTFTLETFVLATNAYLANGIGNLGSRALTLYQKNFKGLPDQFELTSADNAILAKRAETLQAWNQGFEELKFQNSIKAWSDLVAACDLYINDMKPWALAKAEPGTPDHGRLQVVLAVCAVMLRALGVLIYPVLPKASQKLCSALGADPMNLKHLNDAVVAPSLPATLTEVPKLFMRVSLPVVTEEEAPNESKKK